MRFNSVFVCGLYFVVIPNFILRINTTSYSTTCTQHQNLHSIVHRRCSLNGFSLTGYTRGSPGIPWLQKSTMSLIVFDVRKRSILRWWRNCSHCVRSLTIWSFFVWNGISVLFFCTLMCKEKKLKVKQHANSKVKCTICNTNMQQHQYNVSCYQVILASGNSAKYRHWKCLHLLNFPMHLPNPLLQLTSN